MKELEKQIEALKTELDEFERLYPDFLGTFPTFLLDERITSQKQFITLLEQSKSNIKNIIAEHEKNLTPAQLTELQRLCEENERRAKEGLTRI